MATADIVSLWIYLFSLLQSCTSSVNCRMHHRRITYDVLHQRTYVGAAGHSIGCFLGHSCWFCLLFRTWFVGFKLHGNFGLHLESRASVRKMYASCGGTWEGIIRIGNRTATYSTSECQKTHSGISAKPMASILRKQQHNYSYSLPQPRGWLLLCTA